MDADRLCDAKVETNSIEVDKIQTLASQMQKYNDTVAMYSCQVLLPLNLLFQIQISPLAVSLIIAKSISTFAFGTCRPSYTV